MDEDAPAGLRCAVCGSALESAHVGRARAAGGLADGVAIDNRVFCRSCAAGRYGSGGRRRRGA